MDPQCPSTFQESVKWVRAYFRYTVLLCSVLLGLSLGWQCHPSTGSWAETNFIKPAYLAFDVWEYGAAHVKFMPTAVSQEASNTWVARIARSLFSVYPHWTAGSGPSRQKQLGTKSLHWAKSLSPGMGDIMLHGVIVRMWFSDDAGTSRIHEIQICSLPLW